MKRVLFTGGGGAGSEAFSDLMVNKYIAHFADADIRAMPPGIQKTHWHQIPNAGEEMFGNALRDVLRTHHIDVLIPSVDEELEYLAENRTEMGCDVLLPQKEVVSLCLDKKACMEYLKAQGASSPKQWSVENAGTFPCITKPRRGRGSRDVRIINSKEELNAYMSLMGYAGNDVVIQEYIKGQEFTVMMAANSSGDLIGIGCVKVDVKKGITIRASIDNDPIVIRDCIRMHNSLKAAGTYNIQCIKTKDRAVPFEINPRISTTSCLCYAAGIDFISAYYEERKGLDSPTLCREGASIKRSWRNTISTG